MGSSNVSGQLFIGKFITVIADLDSNGQTELAEALKTLESLPNGITSRGINWGSRSRRPKNKRSHLVWSVVQFPYFQK
jgi:hypothetical protein